MAVDAARAKSLFLAASDLADPQERAAYLDRECGGDAALRARVEALLRANDAAPLPPAGAGHGTSAHVPDRLPETEDYGDPTARVGAVLAGRYKLVEVIGEGGMGSVFLAQQTEPVKRAVAVKVIKAGMDSKAVLARFEAERQALAMMDHPNIAKVLDAAATDGGRPFFVMELVKGTPITQFCDERRLTPRQRLELFVPVCQAIQHAHQKGVIHRDIKPSNVLVALYDDHPVPKVIDFGVAKAAGQALTDKTLMTGFGAVVGTPEYMSPEQASLNNLDIDTRSDVYALGILLYELLTGSPPFSRRELEKAGVLEILRVIREQEPQKPSTRLSTADALPTIAASRGTEPAKLTKLVRGELDWIVMKALEKDRARRYETANGFAQDVQRYLADEPVLACPPSLGYRLRKFVRRNQGRVIAASLLLIALLVGIAGTTVGLIRATHAEWEMGKALTQVTEEQTRTQAALTKVQEADADSRRGLARQYVDRGGKLLAEGDYAGALTWFAAAWEKEADVIDAEAEAIHRLRLTATAQVAPRPVQVCNHGAGGRVAMWLTPDGRRVVTYASPSRNRNPDDGTVRVWDLVTGRPVTPPLPHHDLSGGRQLRPVELLREGVGDVGPPSFSRDGRRMVTTANSPAKGERGERVIARVWDTETGQPVSPEIHCGDHWSSLSPDGTRLLTVTSIGETVKGVPRVTGGEARVWDVRTGNPVSPPLVMPDGFVPIRFGAEFVADGTRVFTSTGLASMLWNADTGKPLTPLLYGGGMRDCWTADQSRLVAAEWPANSPPPLSQEQLAALRVRVWDGRTGQPLTPPLELEDNQSAECDISPDGNLLGYLVTVDGQHAARVADAATGKTVATLTNEGVGLPNRGAFFLPGGRSVLTTSGVVRTPSPMAVAGVTHDWVRVWDAKTGKPVTAPISFDGALDDWQISDDGRHLLLQGRPSANVSAPAGGVQVWILPSGEAGTPLILHQDQNTRGALSPDGRQLLTYGGTNARVWDADTGQPRTPVLSHARPVLSHARPVAVARFTPDGRSVVCACEDGRVCVWPAWSGEPEARLLASSETLYRMWPDPTGARLLTQAFPQRLSPSGESSDGQATASDASNELKLWDLTAGRGMVLQRQGNAEAQAGGFSPRGRWVVAFGHFPRGLKCWDAQDFSVAAEVRTAVKPGRVWFDPDETVLAYEVDLPDKGKQTFAVRLPGGEPTAAVPAPTARRGREGPVVELVNSATARIKRAPPGRDLLIQPPGGVQDGWSGAGGQLILTSGDAGQLFPMMMIMRMRSGYVAWAQMEKRKFAVWVWDARTGQPVLPPLRAQGVNPLSTAPGASPAERRNNLRAYVFARPDEFRVVYPAADGLRVWDLPRDTRTPAEWVRLSAAIHGQQLGEGGLEPLADADWVAARTAHAAAVGRSPPPLLEWLTRQADEAERANDIPGLRIVLKRLIELEPNNWMHYRRLGRYTEGNWEESIRLNTRAIELGTTAWQVWTNRGVAYLHLGRLAEADEDLTKAVKMVTEKSAMPWRHLLFTRLARGDLAGYRQAFADAEAFFGPDFNNRGNIHNSVFDPLEFAVLVPDVVPDPKRLLAWEAQQAAKHKGSASRHYPEVLLRAGRYEEALKHFLKRGPVIPPRLDLIPLLAMTYHHLGQHDKAREALDRAAALHAKYVERREPVPGRSQPYSLEARIVFRAYYKEACALIGDPPAGEVALLVLEERLKLTKAKFGPEHAETIKIAADLARGYRSARQFDKAAATSEVLWAARQKALPEGDWVRIDTQNHLGLMLLFAGRFAEAEPHLLASYRDGTGAKDFPKDWPAIYVLRLVSLYAEWGKLAEATKWQQEQEKLGDAAVARLPGMGLEMLEGGRFKAAENLLRELLAIREKSQPDVWTTFHAKSMLGGALLGQKKYADAEPLLLAGYEGMKQREKTISPQSGTRVLEALDRLIELYTATDKPDKAEKWREERAKYPEAKNAAAPEKK